MTRPPQAASCHAPPQKGPSRLHCPGPCATSPRGPQWARCPRSSGRRPPPPWPAHARSPGRQAGPSGRRSPKRPAGLPRAWLTARPAAGSSHCCSHPNYHHHYYCRHYPYHYYRPWMKQPQPGAGVREGAVGDCRGLAAAEQDGGLGPTAGAQADWASEAVGASVGRPPSPATLGGSAWWPLARLPGGGRAGTGAEARPPCGLRARARWPRRGRWSRRGWWSRRGCRGHCADLISRVNV